jgi:hypothetical protein
LEAVRRPGARAVDRPACCKGTTPSLPCRPISMPYVQSAHHAKVRWYLSRCRGSQKRRLTWRRMNVITEKFLPLPRILHPWPEQRFLGQTPTGAASLCRSLHRNPRAPFPLRHLLIRDSCEETCSKPLGWVEWKRNPSPAAAMGFADAQPNPSYGSASAVGRKQPVCSRAADIAKQTVDDGELSLPRPLAMTDRNHLIQRRSLQNCSERSSRPLLRSQHIALLPNRSP